MWALMPRRRYKQEPLPLGNEAPPAELFGPEQANPPGLQRTEQGLLGVVPLGPLFDEAGMKESNSSTVLDGETQGKP